MKTPPQVEKLLYTKKEAAWATARSVKTLDRMIAAKRISTRRSGRRVLIPASEVRRIAATNDYGLYGGVDGRL